MEGVLVIKTCLPNFKASSTEGVLVTKNLSVKLFSFFSGGSIGDQERVCQTLQLHQWREYWWWRTCLSNSSVSSVEALLVIKNVSVKISASLMEGVLVIKNVSVKLFSFIMYCRGYWWSRTCLSNSSASLMEGVLVIKNVSVKLFSFSNYWWSRCPSNSLFINVIKNVSANLMEGVLVIKTYLQLLQRRDYLWPGTCLPNSSASSMEGVLVIKNVSVKISASLMEGVLVMTNVSVKLFSFFSGGSIGDQERVCQTLQLHQWREYWWWRTCLSNSSASSMEGVLVIKNVSVKFSASSTEGVLVKKNVSVKLFSFFSGGSICDQERVCQTLQLHQWREYWWWRTCLSNSSVSSVEAVLVIKKMSVKLSSFFIGGSIGDQERVCQTLQLLQWREYWWSKRVCQILKLLQRREYWWRRTWLSTLQFLQWRQYWWSRTCLSNSSTSSMEGVLVMKNVSVKLFSFFSGGIIGDQERVC